jgi:secreted trypsin-like serine protease
MLLKFVLISIVFGCVLAQNFTHLSAQRFKRQSQSCGVPFKKSVGLILGGETFERGAWPWMVAMFTQKNKVEKFFCSGTLVSSTKVVTGEKLTLISETSNN